MKQEVTPSGPAFLELSARHPYDAFGNLDVYMPGRWDTTADVIFMDTIVRTGAGGEWVGSAAYIEFRPPAPGTLPRSSVTSPAHEITMHLTGPWGERTAYTPTISEPGAVRRARGSAATPRSGCTAPTTTTTRSATSSRCRSSSCSLSRLDSLTAAFGSSPFYGRLTSERRRLTPAEHSSVGIPFEPVPPIPRS